MSFGKGSLSLKVEGALEGSSGGREWYDFCRRSMLNVSEQTPEEVIRECV